MGIRVKEGPRASTQALAYAFTLTSPTKGISERRNEAAPAELEAQMVAMEAAVKQARKGG